MVANSTTLFSLGEALFKLCESDGEGVELTDAAFAMSVSGALGGALPVFDLAGQFVEQAVAFVRGLVGIKLRLDRGLDLVDAPPAIFFPGAARAVHSGTAG